MRVYKIPGHILTIIGPRCLQKSSTLLFKNTKQKNIIKEEYS